MKNDLYIKAVLTVIAISLVVIAFQLINQSVPTREDFSKLKNIENIVGALINTVPLRVKLNNDDLIIDHLRRIEDGFVQVEPYQFIGLSDIQIAAGFKKPFFSNAIVFENYPKS